MHIHSIIRRATTLLALFLSACAFAGCTITDMTAQSSGVVGELPAEIRFAAFPLNAALRRNSLSDVLPVEVEPVAVAQSRYDARAERIPTLPSGKLSVLDMVKTASIYAAPLRLWTGKRPVAFDFRKGREEHSRYDPVEGLSENGKSKLHPVLVSSAVDQTVNSLLEAEPGSIIKSGIKVMHLLGIILGLGAATVLDLFILRFLVLSKINHEHVTLVEFVSKIVTAGLVILWISGLSYLLHYAVFDPAKLGNQKVWAKITIVAMLTVNGYFIHHSVLPLIRKQVGGALFRGLGHRERTLLITFGTISATSWYVPLVLGAMPQLNFVVPATSILSAYAILLAIAVAFTQGIAHAIWRDQPSRKAEVHSDGPMRRLAAAVRLQGAMPAGLALT